MLINHFEYYYSIDILIYTIYINGTRKKSTKRIQQEIKTI